MPLLLRLLPAFALMALAFGPAAAQGDLIAALRGGGYVIVMRHAHSPAQPPPPGQADPGNKGDERQLDQAGEDQAAAIGRAIKARGIPIAAVYSSPTFRAQQTVRLMGLQAVEARPELGDGGASMAATAAGKSGTAWLKAKAAEAPPQGGDVLIVTHGPNIALAFGEAFKDMGDAEAAVFRPDGRGGFALAGRIKPADWGG